MIDVRCEETSYASEKFHGRNLAVIRHDDNSSGAQRNEHRRDNGALAEISAKIDNGSGVIATAATECRIYLG